MRARLLICTALAASLLTGCAPKVYHTADFQRLKPRTVVVLPPENTTSNTEVMEKAYPFIFSNLAQRGYYVIAPELAMQLFRANKLNDAGRINQLPTEKMNEVFGVDAVLKTRVTEWSSKYMVLTSTVNVGYEMELVDAKTGTLLWKHKQLLSKAPGGNSSSLTGMLVNAAMHAAVTPYEPIASENAQSMLVTVPMGDVRANP